MTSSLMVGQQQGSVSQNGIQATPLPVPGLMVRSRNVAAGGQTQSAGVLTLTEINKLAEQVKQTGVLDIDTGQRLQAEVIPAIGANVPLHALVVAGTEQPQQQSGFGQQQRGSFGQGGFGQSIISPQQGGSNR
jgi:hypothetical protein